MGRGHRRLISLVAAASIDGLGLAGCGGASASSPQRVADQLEQTDGALRTAIEGWRAGGGPPATAPPQDVLDQSEALHDDARYLAAHPNLTRQVLPLLPSALAAQWQRLTRA